MGEVAALYGITVRTLHHWDELGLVVPSGRTWAGYRVYSPADAERIQQVLIYRETGMGLADIKNLLNKSECVAIDHLRHQRELLVERAEAIAQMITAIDTLMENEMNADRGLSTEQKAKILGDIWNPEYEQEAKEKWGDTADWHDAHTRQNQMTKKDWIECRDQTEALEADLAEAMSRGVVAGSSEANALAERHLAQLNRWFDADREKQLLIARGYLCDPRFVAHYDKRADGLTQWLVGIIEANAKAHAATSQQDQ